MNYYGKIEEADTLIGNMGVGVDYYKGETGAQGIPGKDGKDGKTPIKGVDYYTDEEIASIKDEIAQKVQVGAKGEDGKSAYQIAVDEGFEGSEADWLASLKGTDGRNGIDGINGTNGKDGTNGIDGKTPVKGVDYFTAAEIEAIEQGAANKVDTAGYAKSADLSTVATSGSYEDLTNKPNIPDAYELPVASATTLGGVKVGSGLDITNGVLSATGGGVADAVDWSKVQNKPNFANVATSGNYNDLINQPTIPSVEGLASEAYVNEKVAAIVIPEVPTKVSELENDKGYLTEHQSLEGYAKTADLAQIAKTGSYNDLADKPTIPSTAGLASTKYVDDKVAGIVIPAVPTKVSAFENDKGYLTEHQSLADYALKSEIPSTTNLATKAEVQEVENKIPAPYTLPTASTSTLGGVKVDGNTITIADGVISAKGGSGGAEPDAYIKDASVSGNTLTLTKKDDTEVVFTPSGGSGDIKSYSFPTGSLTTEEIANLQYCVDNPTKAIFTINDIRIQNMYNSSRTLYFSGVIYRGGNLQLIVYSIAATSTTITGTNLSTFQSGDDIVTYSTINNYLSSWHIADSLQDSNLYNARELTISLENSDGKCFSQYYNFSCSFDSAYDSGGLGMYVNKNFSLQLGENEYQLWHYNGSEMNINLNGMNNYRIFYKT